MSDLTINPKWSERLKEAGLDTLQSLLEYSGGKCLSTHKRGATFRTSLADGTVIFIKRDHFTFKKEILKDMLRFRKPAQKTVKERLAFQAVRASGFIAPEVIAYGTSTRFGLPHQAAFIMLEIPGKNLDSYIKETNSDEKCKEAVAKAENTMKALQKQGFDWPDNKPEHFIVMPDGDIALIDLERLAIRNIPLSSKKSQAQLLRFRSMLPKASITPANN